MVTSIYSPVLWRVNCSGTPWPRLPDRCSTSINIEYSPQAAAQRLTCAPPQANLQRAERLISFTFSAGQQAEGAGSVFHRGNATLKVAGENVYWSGTSVLVQVRCAADVWKPLRSNQWRFLLPGMSKCINSSRTDKRLVHNVVVSLQHQSKVQLIEKACPNLWLVSCT